MSLDSFIIYQLMSEKSGSRKSIHLFDLDDTLIQTEARVWIVNLAGEKVFALTPSEFTSYRPKVEEKFDFTEFSDLGILSRGIVVKYTKTIIDTILKQGTESQFGILTARGDKKLHAPFLVRFFKSLFGIRLAKENIFAVSDTRFSIFKDKVRADPKNRMEDELDLSPKNFLALSVAERKALVIAEDLVGAGFNDISFYDDSRENLNSFKILRQRFPNVVYKPHLIDPTWKVRLGEFAASELERKPLLKGLVSAKLILENHSEFGEHWAMAQSVLEKSGKIQLEHFPILLVFDSGRYFLKRT